MFALEIWYDPMRILFITEIDLARPDGPTAHVLGLAGGMRELGHEIMLLVPPPGGEIDCVPDGVWLLVAPVPRIPKLMRPLFGWLGARLVMKQVREFAPELVYLRVGHYTWFAPMLARVLGVPLISEVNGILEDHMRGARRNFALAKCIIAHECECLRASALIVAVTPNIREHVLCRDSTLAPGKVISVANGVDVRRMYPMDREEARAHVGLPRNGFLIGYCGTLDWWQGVEVLLAAFANVCRARSDVRLLVAGHGRKEEDLYKQAQLLGIAEQVTFSGRFSLLEAVWYIAACDICVVPKHELRSGYSPIKLYQYMACARPVVASAVAGMEFIEHGHAGILFRPGDVDALTMALQELLRDEKRSRSMGAEGRVYVEKFCTWAAVAGKILKRIG